MNDISQFLAHADSARTVWFTDFDGVLYRGMFPRWTQGISNAEFALAFWALHAAHPVRSLRILRGLVHIGRLRIRLYRGYRAGKCTLGETEYPLIRRFVERVLRPGLPEYILPAARWTVRFCDPDGLGTLGEVRGRGTAVVVLSKAFTPVLDAAGARMRTEFGVTPILHGVPLVMSPELRIDNENAILTALAKSEHARRLLALHPEWTSAVCVGDTEEDAPMFHCVREVLGRANVRCITIRPRDITIREAADAVFGSWKEFRQASTRSAAAGGP